MYPFIRYASTIAHAALHEGHGGAARAAVQHRHVAVQAGDEVAGLRLARAIASAAARFMGSPSFSQCAKAMPHRSPADIPPFPQYETISGWSLLFT